MSRPTQNCASLRSALHQQRKTDSAPSSHLGPSEAMKRMRDSLCRDKKLPQWLTNCSTYRAEPEPNVCATDDWSPDAVDEWVGAFERFRSRIAASIRSISVAGPRQKGANIMKAILMTPTPEGSKLAWEPRFPASRSLRRGLHLGGSYSRTKC